MVQADPNGESAGGVSNQRNLIISSNNFIHMNEGNIKSFYKISSCIGRGKFSLGWLFSALGRVENAAAARIAFD